MFFFRHFFLRGFHPETRFSIRGWRHWIFALVNIGWWVAMTWLSVQGYIYATLASERLSQIAQRADLTTAEERHISVTALVVIVVGVVLVSMVTALDCVLRLCLEICLWVASSVWRYAPFRRLASRMVEGVERKVLRRTPEWRVELIYPGARAGGIVRGAAIKPSGLAQQIGRERTEVLSER